MVAAPEYRHAELGALVVLAQRLGKARLRPQPGPASTWSTGDAPGSVCIQRGGTEALKRHRDRLRTSSEKTIIVSA